MDDLRRNRAVTRGGLRNSTLAIAVLCLSAALAGCGGGDDEDPAAAQTPAPNPNPPGTSTLTISGTPPAQAMQGQVYSFTPTVSPSGGTLTFSMLGNTPAWATLSATTGRLSGTPTPAQVGTTTSNVRIRVSNGTNTADLPAFSVTVVGTATGSALLSWTPPTTNVDGSALTLTGYKIYYGTSQGLYPNQVSVGPNLTSYMIEQLTPATYYFVATSLSANGESSYSNVATKVVQ